MNVVRSHLLVVCQLCLGTRGRAEDRQKISASVDLTMGGQHGQVMKFQVDTEPCGGSKAGSWGRSVWSGSRGAEACCPEEHACELSGKASQAGVKGHKIGHA